jgi:hypothetical protein
VATKLVDVVTWKGRTRPGHRIIPRHLKLAILARGRIDLPSSSVEWLVDLARQRGETWPDRLDMPFADIVDSVAVTIELLWQQPATMLDSEVDSTIAPYLRLRHQRHLRHCWFVLYGWTRHATREALTRPLDLDIARLYAKPRVFPRARDQDRYIVVAYACIPPAVIRHIKPEFPEPEPPPAPPSDMPALEGLTASNVMRHLRTEASTSAESLGELIGQRQWVDVLTKKRAGDLTWLQIRLRHPLTVTKAGKDVSLPGGTEAWVERAGLDIVVAPWTVFRAQFAAWEQELSSLSLGERITALRQMTHARDLPFDHVIGVAEGATYAEGRPIVDDRWQVVLDYTAFRAPDDKLIDIHHVLVGLDALQHRESYPDYATIPVGSSWAAATWSGDIAAGIADMQTKRDENWEKRNRKARDDERTEHYYNTRASDPDLFADIDAWQLNSIRRAGTYDTIDLILASYYERTLDGQLAALTRDRSLAFAKFLDHYGFTYDVDVDYQSYPVLLKQQDGVERVIYELEAFARIWILKRDPMLVIVDDPDAKDPDSAVVRDMATIFLTWLEHEAIANGVSF